MTRAQSWRYRIASNVHAFLKIFEEIDRKRGQWKIWRHKTAEIMQLSMFTLRMGGGRGRRQEYPREL